MSKLLFILTLLSFAGVSGAQTTAGYCAKFGGQMVGKLQCPQSEKLRESVFCVLGTRPLVYFNGCTASIGEYGTIFYKSCLKHDFCYHHEPATNGLSKKDCDKKFHRSMVNICKTSGSKFKTCRAMAWAFYQAVKAGGKKSWECSNSDFDYSNIDKVFTDLDL